MTAPGKTILLVEDEAIVAMAEIRQLKRYGYNVIHVLTGEEAIAVIKKDAAGIGLILMDIDLGAGIDGAVAAQEILKTHDIPILFLSSHIEKEIVEKTEKIASYGYVVKNTGVVILDASIKTALALFDTRRETRNVSESATINEERLRHALEDSIIETIPIMIFIKDAKDLAFVRVNRAGEELLGYPRADMLGKGDRDFFPKEQADFFTRNDHEALRNKKIVDTPEEIIHTKDKGDRVLHTWKVPIVNENGEPEYLLGISEDITEKKRIEMALRASEERYRAFIDSASDMIYLKDEGFRYIIINKNLARFFERSEQDIIGKTDYELMPQDAADNCHESDIKAIQTASIITTEEPIGDKVYETIKFTVPLDSERDGIGGIIRDITERKRAEIELEQSAREKEILMRELQHRVKNNLFLVSSLLSLNKKELHDEKSRAVFQDAIDRIHSISAIYEQLYRTAQIDRIDLRPYLNNIIEYMRQAYLVESERIQIDARLESVQCDLKRAVPLGLILNELVTNALKHAYPRGGNGVIRVGLELTGATVTLSVSDNGIGMPEDFTVNRLSCMGINLINLLSKEIGGELKWETSRGTVASIAMILK